MAEARLTRTTVQALVSVDKEPTPPAPITVDRVANEPVLLDSHLAGAPAASADQMVEPVVKRKRGRPPKNPGMAQSASSAAAAAAAAAANKRNKKEEEDVCFICFDGGKLVLCDRRDCPKAYHPACVKRDESFFRRSIRWNCGWHLCNICQRNALFMCYTCPYSLCKGCVKQADILCVRGNKGFCRTCMTTVMLIENIPQETKELVQVDFDDTTSWEYLFKVYWIYLREKEALTLDELTQATNPWKGSGFNNNFQQNRLDTCVNKVSELSSSNVQLEANALRRRKTRKQLQLVNVDSQKLGEADGNSVSGLHRGPDWASKELLEFVAHMKNGDTSVLSQFDVQGLVLDYIRKNNLRDPRQKCQIICDKRLGNLFGKERVGHFEMLKLLEYHFKEESRTNGLIRGAAIDPLAGQVYRERISGDNQTLTREMKRQCRRKGDDKGRQINLDNYAAIDIHNINLIYLKRSLLENLIVDAENFHDKAVGSVVRIRISSNDQKQDMHRLVRIIGTSKASEPYKIGDKTENLMLKILNLNNIEDIPIDAISDQEFSEDECRRLRQSIKLGLVERMRVGEIQEKAMALQKVRVNDWLETEIRRLNHLRDRASEMGHRKELRDCVEKIELLKTPEERQRRIHEIPEVHADPRMDPSYGSDDDSGESDIKKQDGSVTPKYSSFNSKGMELISPVRLGDMSKDDRTKALKPSAANGDRKRKHSAKFHVGKVEGATKLLESPQKTERVAAFRLLEELHSRADLGVVSSGHGVAPTGSVSQATSDSATIALSSGLVLVSHTGELEKIWHYRDPSGKVQGPFCMLQLRKWDSNGFFPTDLKVWRINETPDQSILLTDALKRQQPSEPHVQQRSCLQSHDRAKSDDGRVNCVEELSSNTDAPAGNHKPNEEGGTSNLTEIAASPEANELSVSVCSTVPVSDNQCGVVHDSGQSMQNIKARLIESLFDSDEPCSAITGTCSSEAMHVAFESESSHPLSSIPKSDNVDMGSQAMKTGPSSPIAGGPDSGTRWSMASKGTKASDHSSSMPQSKHEDLQSVHVENKHNDTSNPCKDLSAGCKTGSCAIEFSDLPSLMPKAENKYMGYHETDHKHSAASAGHEQDSCTSNTVSVGIDVSVLPNAAPVENEGVKHHTAQSRQSTSSDVPGRYSGGIQSPISGGTDVSTLASTMPNEDTKALALENKHNVASNVTEQDSGTSWSTISGGIMFSDLPSTSPQTDNNGLKTPVAEVKGCVAPNIHGQESGTSWSTMSGAIGFSDLPDTSLKLDNEASRVRAVENRSSVTANIPGQEPCISWSTASNLVGGEVHLPDSCQLTHCSPDNPHCWQPIELSTLGDQSVSDLLSEVEAMESLRGMSSPTSRMNCGDGMIDSLGDDCFSPLGGLSPTFDPGKSDALSSTADIQFHVQPNPTDQQHGSFHVDVHDLPRTSCVLSTLGPEVEEVKPATTSMPQNFVSEAPMPALLPPPPPLSPPPPPPPPPPKPPSPATSKLSVDRPSSPREDGEVEPTSASVHHPKAGPENQPLPQTASMKIAAANTWKQGSETTSTGFEPPAQQSGKFSSTGSILGNPNMHWSTSGQGMAAVSWSSSVVSQGPRGASQTSPRYSHSSGRHSGPKDRSHHHHGVDSGFGKSRPNSWSRQSSFGGGGGGSRPPHRGQRVCKFYESGYCKKGASCNYLHP